MLWCCGGSVLVSESVVLGGASGGHVGRRRAWTNSGNVYADGPCRESDHPELSSEYQERFRKSMLGY